ncbi:uncharacterized protein LOC128272294 [Anopheles cruzii]|uniref:uncharacterized protein LOC128272294 n=1 Tax=Anopheles cruzii TaxID=68878 RepID=UPI0022EC8EAD|nr:uncharacterized protein LOC128272294 [Anopheles cruzii]
MKAILLVTCCILASVNAAQAIKCMQGTESVNLADTDKPKDNEKTPEFVECGILNTATSAAALLVLKPNTATSPSTDYKCFHLRAEDSQTKWATIVKGCIYKAQNVCDGKFKLDTMREVFCSQCEQDECNGAVNLAAPWKILSLTVFAVAFYLFK